MRKPGQGTKSRIISAAWRLFYEQGYENTTIEDIVAESETSKGSFYHYFPGKDALLGTLSTLFDEKYESLIPTLDEQAPALDTLLLLNRELFLMIENSVSIELLGRLLSTQLVSRGERHLLDRSRTYFRLLLRIVRRGQETGELRTDLSANDIVKAYALCERGFLYDWCLCGGEYALSRYSAPMLEMFLAGFVAKA
jgi:AcrR family transcriptional regulator